jgi:arylformamidase
MRIWDISLTITPETPRYPGKEIPRRTILSRIEDGAVANCSAVYLDCHFGTHVDSPRHFVRDGITIEQVDVARFCGPCRVVEIQGRRDIRTDDLAGVPAGIRVLFKTCGSDQFRACIDDPNGFAYLTPDAAQRLVELDTRLVGIDGFSIDEYGSSEPSHLLILPAGIPILECIDLTGVTPGDYDLTVLPLKLAGAEAAPARAILKSL